MITTVPFMKNNELNYGDLFATAGSLFNGLYAFPTSHRYFPDNGRQQRCQYYRRLPMYMAGNVGHYWHYAGYFAFVSGNALLADY
jgi:phospho-N-acetylmuramoyl-pentapeptide-transferase